MAHDTLTALLAQRIRTDGASPFITFYDLESGERTELSAITFGNWVDKTAGFARDELDLQVADRVHVALPLHWQTLVWWMAAVRAGLIFGDDEAAVHIVGPDESQWSAAGVHGAQQIVALSLQPWGRGFANPPPAPIVDFADQVRLFPDVFAESIPPASSTLLNLGGATLTYDELADVATEHMNAVGHASPARILVADEPESASDFTRALVELLIAPLMTKSSLVLVRHAVAGNLNTIAAQEQTNDTLRSPLPVRPD